MSLLLIPVSTPVSITTSTTITEATTTTITTTTTTTTTTAVMSIILAISLIAVTLLFLEISSYVSIWWYREADHSEQDTCFEFNSHPESSWNTSGLGVCKPYSQPLPMPSSSFFVRGIDESIRDLPVRSEMQAHSHRAIHDTTSPICHDLNTDKIQTIRSGFDLSHHSVSRPARELPQMGGGRQVQGPNPFLASTYQNIPSPQYIAIGRAVVHLPPPAVHSLPPPALYSLIPEILVPTVVDPIQSLSVDVSHTPDRHDIQISGILKRKPEEPDMMSTMQPPKNRRIQEILGRANRPVNILPTILPEPASQRIVDQPPRRQYAWASLAQPEPLPVLQGTDSVGRLISFRNIAVGAMEASPPLEIHGGTPKWTAPTLDQERNKPCSRMDMPRPQRETVPAQSKTVSDMVSLWNARSNGRSNDMDVDVNVAAPPPPVPVKYGIQSVSAMEWAHPNTQAETTSKKVSLRTTEHVDPVSIAPVPLPRRSVSAEEMDRLWAESVERRNKMNIRSSFEIFQEAFSQRPWQSRGVSSMPSTVPPPSPVAPSTSRTRPPLLPSNGRTARVLRVADPTRKKRMERL
ncbi:hypothetical protein BASA50_009608 [Batrachochytrium salamandrivorans]|uniref:Uncharacterized protein n=1 Tax=Batrachochytrium salamandrivorans TaxID=1357716 RepID=A0ABQ8F0T7_9FUNG|nr:hypothetical protein BASA50_009608 [Batrachochytrium salamandrivorans]